MTRYLLDTHALLWWAREPERLSVELSRRVGLADAVFASAVSLWEIVIKETGRNPMVGTDDALGWFTSTAAASGFTVLPIEISHIAAVQRLPLHHRDPFDRLLIAQATVEGFTIVSKDRHFGHYDVSVFWDEADLGEPDLGRG